MAEDREGSAASPAPLYAGFLLTGVVTVLPGPLLPELAGKWSLPVEALAPLFAAQFLASSVGAVLSSYRLGASLVLGYLLIAGGLVSLALATWPLALVAVAATGLGLGLAIPATNLRVAHARPERRGAALSSLNLVWGVGAVACPLLFAVRPREMSSDLVLLALAAAAALVMLLLFPLLRAARGAPAGTGESKSEAAPPTDGSEPTRGDDAPSVAALPVDRRRRTGGKNGNLRTTPGLVLLAAVMFLYVGIENSVGGWLVSLADALQPGRTPVSLWIGSGFWAALLAVRAVAPFLLRRISEASLYAAGVAVAGAGLLGLVASGSEAGVAASAVAVGAGLAPLFPLTVSFLAELTASTRSRNTGWVFALAGMGGAVLPWLTGRLAGGTQGLSAGFVAPAAGLVLLALLFGLLRRLPTFASPRSA